jgi:lipopolysaccharide/colanic/teichoic acid biosynthesis glycosyltransferase
MRERVVARDALHHAVEAAVNSPADSACIEHARHRSQTVRRIAVIGDGEFVQHMHRVPRRRGDLLVASWDTESAGLLTANAVLPEFDLLVVQAEYVVRLGDVPKNAAGLARVIALTADDIRGPQPRPFDSPLPLSARVAKRCLDLAIATVALLLLSPVMLVAALAIRIDSPGRVVFRQTRVGVDGRRFTCYKLRTMVVGNDHARHAEYVTALIEGRAVAPRGLYKLTNDSRITNVGRHLRRLSVDEFPQLWNVVRGDMSLVGPRPPLPYEVDLYDGPALQRLRVKPGLTGLWQVSGRCELTFSEMVALDNQYWRNWSFICDLRIILRTPLAILRGRGAT